MILDSARENLSSGLEVHAANKKTKAKRTTRINNEPTYTIAFAQSFKKQKNQFRGLECLFLLFFIFTAFIISLACNHSFEPVGKDFSARLA